MSFKQVDKLDLFFFFFLMRYLVVGLLESVDGLLSEMLNLAVHLLISFVFESRLLLPFFMSRLGLRLQLSKESKVMDFHSPCLVAFSFHKLTVRRSQSTIEDR